MEDTAQFDNAVIETPRKCNNLIRARQLALSIQYDDKSDEEFDITDEGRAIVHLFLITGNKTKAYRDVKNQSRSEPLKEGSARSGANKFFNRDNVALYLEYRRQQMMKRNKVSEDEVVKNAREIYLTGTGKLAVKKSFVTKEQDEEEQHYKSHELVIYEPNLSAANQANNLLARIAGVIDGGQSGRETPAEELKRLAQEDHESASTAD